MHDPKSFGRDLGKFVVLSRGRTGSTFLMEALNMHPEIRMYSEILKHPNPSTINGKTFDPNQDSWRFIMENLWISGLERETIVGFKLFYFHANGSTVARRVWRELERSEDIAIVNSSRQNIFASFVSARRAVKTGVWQPGNTESYTNNVEIEIDIEDMHRHLDAAESEYDYGKRLTEDKKGIFVTYEQMRDGVAGVLARLAGFLGASACSLSVKWPEFVDGSESSGATRITNLDEVVDELEKRGAGWMAAPFF